MKLLLSLLIFISCQTPTTRERAIYANRPLMDTPPCIANGDSTCFRDGEEENVINYLCGRGSEYDAMQDHIEFLEKFYYECKKFNRCD